MAEHSERKRRHCIDRDLAAKIAAGELPGGDFFPPDEPPVFPPEIGDVLFQEPGAPPPNFAEDVGNEEICET